MDDAVKALQALLDSGMEWPDAVWKVTQQFKVSAEALESAFDNQE